jgi:hypothetical protein
MNQKSVSLPRLYKDDDEKSPKKINKDIHKVRWSMAPKCLMEGHDGKDILYVCINPKC